MVFHKGGTKNAMIVMTREVSYYYCTTPNRFAILVGHLDYILTNYNKCLHILHRRDYPHGTTRNFDVFSAHAQVTPRRIWRYLAPAAVDRSPRLGSRRCRQLICGQVYNTAIFRVHSALRRPVTNENAFTIRILIASRRHRMIR